MNKFFVTLSLLFFCIIILNNCGKIRESAGVNRKVIDEYKVVKNPPLALPPDYNLLPSEEIIAKKNLSENNKDLSKEILFGLDENSKNVNNINQSTALDSIMNKSGASKASPDIRDEIDSDILNTSSTRGVFSGEKYMNEHINLARINSMFFPLVVFLRLGANMRVLSHIFAEHHRTP